MRRFAFALLGLLFLQPATAQEWGSGYNMGSLAATGGNDALGSITIDCAEAGNGVVPQGALTLFLKPAQGVKAKAVEALDFAVDGITFTLPLGPDQGDGLVYEKTPETAAQARKLIDLLKTSGELVVTGGGSELARIRLAGAAAALEGFEACVQP